MKKMLGRTSIMVITAASVLTLFGCGDKQEPESQVVGASAPSSVVQPAPVDPLGPRYEAALVEGIDFKKPGYPNFVAKIKGIGVHEPWRRWTEGKSVMIKFKQPLPAKFVLLVVGGAFGPNIGQPTKVKAGVVVKEIVFTTDGFPKTDTHRIDFQLDTPVDTIEFIVPQPTKAAPADGRILELSLMALKIETNPQFVVEQRDPAVSGSGISPHQRTDV